MKTTKEFKRFLSLISLWIFTITTLNPVPALAWSSSKVVYPLKEISKLDCRFTEFDDLKSNCKQNLPVLKTKDYKKYATKDGWYNDYTRLYTVLWGSSYKYGWDVWNWGHMWVDIATSKWTPIYSMAQWTVIIAKDLWMLWNSVSIEHKINWKTVISNYSHMSKISVKKWDKVNAGKKVWEVWSTWNSTGNHLHFQIDIDTTSTPAYYSYNSCPYSYYQITEEWKCFDELERITVDPLLFLETSWAIMDSVSSSTSKSNNSSSKNTYTNKDLSIFEKTVYVWYSKGDVREVQQIYAALGYYKGAINWDYNDVLESVIDYQVETWVIETRNSNWAGWFGPKTRTQTKKDYESYLAKWGTETKVYITESKIKTQKISKKSLLTREEIEAREVKEFIKDYNIDLDFTKAWSNVAVNKTEILKLKVTNKKGKAFKGNMPWWMTFIVNTEKVNVFPQKLYYFTDWKRDIKVTWLSEGNTKLYVKIGNATVKTFDIKVFNWNKTIYPEDAKIYSPSSVVLWDRGTAIAVFKDSNNKNLINLEFGSTYKLKASEWNEVCIKSWKISDVKKIYKSKCNDDDYKESISFDYSDTVWWLLIYDYKALNKNAKFEIVNNYNNEKLAYNKMKVNNPKWLASNYEYKNEVLEMLEQWVVSWINKWYFLEDRELKEADAYTWIENTLEKYNDEVLDQSTRNKVANNLKQIDKKQKSASKYKTITRWQFLALSYKYLIIDDSNIQVNRTYKDLDESQNKIANSIFDENTTWKDQFWESYFQTDNNITRWEWAYILSLVLENNSNKYLTLK